MLNLCAMHLYEYAVVRFMPDAEREEFINIGLVMMCKRRRWIRSEIIPSEAKISVFAPGIDTQDLRKQCEVFSQIAQGQPAGHPIASLDAHERFRWLTAVRSASIVTSRPHPGLCEDLNATFERLLYTLEK